jgi:hypothetical protein
MDPAELEKRKMRYRSDMIWRVEHERLRSEVFSVQNFALAVVWCALLCIKWEEMF